MTGEIMKYGDGKSVGVRTIQINKLIESVVAIFRETFPRDIYLVHDAPADLHEIRADELQIDQVLMNLCIHARNKMPNGGELKITAENTRLDDQYALASKGIAPGPFVKISVRDEGLGYTAEDIKTMFDPARETRDESYLGLVTVKAIVEALEGTIEVQSQPGRWTSFEVYLPAVVEKRDDEPELDPNDKLVEGHGELVLLVDDEPKICELSRETLERHGYKVLTAKDGADAISSYCQKRKDVLVVLMDMKMPVMDGLTAIRVLRNMNPQLKIIATTGSVRGQSEVDSPLLRTDGFLRKPYTTARLLKILSDVINRH